MKIKTITHGKKVISKIKKEIDDLYNRDTCILGDLDNDNYVQLVPKLHALYKDETGKIITLDLSNIDLRKKLPPVMEKQMLGKSNS